MRFTVKTAHCAAAVSSTIAQLFGIVPTVEAYRINYGVVLPDAVTEEKENEISGYVHAYLKGWRDRKNHDVIMANDNPSGTAKRIEES